MTLLAGSHNKLYIKYCKARFLKQKINILSAAHFLDTNTLIIEASCEKSASYFTQLHKAQDFLQSLVLSLIHLLYLINFHMHPLCVKEREYLQGILLDVQFFTTCSKCSRFVHSLINILVLT